MTCTRHEEIGINMSKCKFKCFVNTADALQYIEEREAADSSYVKIGKASKKLIVSFSSNNHSGFERKKSLMSLKYCKNGLRADVLYLRNQNAWYLGGLNGIGKDIDDTVAFLKKEFTNYEEVLCVGSSAGGYASILFASLCGANVCIANIPQTDLGYAIANCQPTNPEADCYTQKITLASLGESEVISLATYNKYKNLKTVIKSTIQYYISCADDDNGLRPAPLC